MYKNIYVENRYDDNPTVHLWDSEKGYIEFDYEKHVYVRSPDGDYESLYGEPLDKVPSSYIDYNTKHRLQEEFGKGRAIYQSDLRIETQILSEVYSGAEEPSDDIETLFFDIEVSMEGQLPDIDTANNPITSIAYTVKSNDESKVLILDKDGNLDSFELDGVEIIPFEEEDELLYFFVEDWRDISPDIVSGWNSSFFDVPYLYRRISRVINNDVANRLSPIGEVEYLKNRDKFVIAGVSELDYLQLYKNFTFTELDSYSLDNVSKEELDRGKVEYAGMEIELDDGRTVTINDLDDLKEYDIERFVEYNMEDVWLVRDLDQKHDFIELARKICHLGHVPYEDIYMSSRYIDGAFVTRLNKRDIIAPNVQRIANFQLDGYHSVGSKEIELKEEIHPDIPKSGTIGIRVSSATKKKVEYKEVRDNKFILENPIDFEVYEDYPIGLEFEGAYVKEPDPGLYDWIYDLDLTSMYPSIIMSLNISPETLVGKIYDWDSEEFLRSDDKTYQVWIFEEERFSEFEKSELKKFLKEGEFSVASNGAFYRNDKQGIIPEVLEEWFTLRQKYKSIRNEWREKSGEEAEEKAEYYDKLQHVHKILINCFTPDHKIVTADSIKDISDVDVGEEVPTLNMDTLEVEMKKISRKYRQEEYDGNIVKIENKDVSFEVTPNHDMLVKIDGDVKKVQAQFLTDEDFVIPGFRDIEVSKDDIEIVEYDGPIVCLEAEDNHTVLAGRDGKFNWIGQSVYGIMGLPSFRFYNVYNASATTLTGQKLIKYTQRMGDHYYNRKIGRDVEFEDGGEMNINLYEKYRIVRDGEKIQVKGKDIKENDILIIEED